MKRLLFGKLSGSMISSYSQVSERDYAPTAERTSRANKVVMLKLLSGMNCIASGSHQTFDCSP